MHSSSASPRRSTRSSEANRSVNSGTGPVHTSPSPSPVLCRSHCFNSVHRVYYSRTTAPNTYPRDERLASGLWPIYIYMAGSNDYSHSNTKYHLPNSWDWRNVSGKNFMFEAIDQVTYDINTTLPTRPIFFIVRATAARAMLSRLRT